VLAGAAFAALSTADGAGATHPDANGKIAFSTDQKPNGRRRRRNANQEH
jgi:hypothetical protein